MLNEQKIKSRSKFLKKIAELETDSKKFPTIVSCNSGYCYCLRHNIKDIRPKEKQGKYSDGTIFRTTFIGTKEQCEKALKQWKKNKTLPRLPNTDNNIGRFPLLVCTTRYSTEIYDVEIYKKYKETVSAIVKHYDKQGIFVDFLKPYEPILNEVDILNLTEEQIDKLPKTSYIGDQLKDQFKYAQKRESKKKEHEQRMNIYKSYKSDKNNFSVVSELFDILQNFKIFQCEPDTFSDIKNL